MNFTAGREKYIFIIKKLSSLFLFIFFSRKGGSSYFQRTIKKTTSKFVNRIQIKKYSSIQISNSADLLWRRARNKRDCNTVWNKLQNGRQLDIKIHVRRNRLGNG